MLVSDRGYCLLALRSIEGGEYAALCIAETDSHRPGFFAPAAKNDAVAVFQKRAVFVASDLNRLIAAGAQFQQRTGLFGSRPRLSAGAEQIAGAQITAVDGVVSDELRDRPIGMSKSG
jgi:hypothetical protein